MNLVNILFQGGWLMLPLVLFSIWGLYIFLERYFAFKKIDKEFKVFTFKLKGLIQNNDHNELINFCSQNDIPAARVIMNGLKIPNSTREIARERFEVAANREVTILEKPLGALGTISGIAPLTGFLGTVTGMIQAFMKIQELGGNVNAGVLAGGIWEALITTAVGLVIGIFAVIAYNLLHQSAKRIVGDLEQLAQDTLDTIS